MINEKSRLFAAGSNDPAHIEAARNYLADILKKWQAGATSRRSSSDTLKRAKKREYQARYRAKLADRLAEG